MEIVIENPTESATVESAAAQGKVESAVAMAAVAVATSPSVTTRTFDRPYDTHYASLQRLCATSPTSPADVETLPVRRVDRSGLLEIADTSRPRHMAGIDPGHVMGTLSRRVDRSGLLEAVPEVGPSTEDGLQEGLEESFGPAGIVHRRSPVTLSAHGSSEDVGRLRSSLWSMEAPANVSLSPVPSPLRLPDYTRLSPSGSDRGRRSRLEGSRLCADDRQEESSCSYSSPPSLISRVRPSSSPIDPSLMHRDCGHGSSQGRMVSRATQPDLIESHDAGRDRSMDKIDKSSDEESVRPEGERAEAEGCEHSSVEGLDERRGSFKSSNELLRNDNVQTLRVIILSEQL